MPLADEVMQAFLSNLERLNEDATNADKEAAKRVVQDIQGRAEVDTGSMRDSVYWTDGKEGTYGEATGAARGDNPRVVIVPQEEARQSAQLHEALVAVAALHGFFVENGYGPEGRRPAKPFFEPGLANAEAYYMEELTK